MRTGNSGNANSIRAYLNLASPLILGLMAGVSYADDALDKAEIYAGTLTKGTAIHVHLFDTEGTDFGNPKFQDTASAMAKSAPHLLATDIVTELRAAGFASVSLDETEGEPDADALNVTGRFTVLNPGSQNLRVWIGFGAGKSKVCVEGEVTDSDGQKLAEFADCRSGLGWGESGPQADTSATILGEEIASFLAGWAEQ